MADPNPAEPVPQSLWALKPWWCQPWSIVLTGLAVVLASWWLLRLWWVSLPVGLAVLVWWWLFLVVVPAAYRASVQNSDL